MSIILKEIDLPKGTEGIGITFHTADGWKETHIFDVNQAIQIPKGHGRLIDASQPSEKIIKAMPRNIYDERDEFYTEGLERAIEEIVDAPTILESEGKEL